MAIYKFKHTTQPTTKPTTGDISVLEKYRQPTQPVSKPIYPTPTGKPIKTPSMGTIRPMTTAEKRISTLKDIPGKIKSTIEAFAMGLTPEPIKRAVESIPGQIWKPSEKETEAMKKYTPVIYEKEYKPTIVKEVAEIAGGITKEITKLVIIGTETAFLVPKVLSIIGRAGSLAPTIAMSLAKGVQLSTTFGIKGLSDEAVRQVTEKKFDAVKLAKETGKEALFGLLLAPFTALPTAAMRIPTVGGAMGGYSLLEGYLKDKTIDKDDLTNAAISFVIGAVFESVNAKAVSRAFKNANMQRFADSKLKVRIENSHPEWNRNQVEDAFKKVSYSWQTPKNNIEIVRILKQEVPPELGTLPKNIQFKYADSLIKDIKGGINAFDALINAQKIIPPRIEMPVKTVETLVQKPTRLGEKPVAVEKITPTKLGEKPTEAPSPLIQEVRKYKSAEEFRQALGGDKYKIYAYLDEDLTKLLADYRKTLERHKTDLNTYQEALKNVGKVPIGFSAKTIKDRIKIAEGNIENWQPRVELLENITKTANTLTDFYNQAVKEIKPEIVNVIPDNLIGLAKESRNMSKKGFAETYGYLFDQKTDNVFKGSAEDFYNLASETEFKAQEVKTEPRRLTLAPTKAKPEEQLKEAAQLGLKIDEVTKRGVYVRPLIGKTELKTMFEIKEFKEKPLLTVEEKTLRINDYGDTEKAKVLVFRGETTQFALKPEALQLNPENLKIGDRIVVDEKTLKTKGAPQQMRIYEGERLYEEVIQGLKQAEIEGKQAGFIKVPKMPVTEGMLRPQIVKMPKKPLFAQLGIEPMREIGKLDPVAGEITMAGREAFNKYEKLADEGRERINNAFKGITLPERVKLVEQQEAGLLTSEVTAKLPLKYQKAINEGLQWFPKEIKKIAQEEFKVDTSQWGYTELNYFHHLFLGNEMMLVDGKTYAIGKRGELLAKAKDLIDEGTPPASIEIKPKFLMGDKPTTLLTQKGFWAFITKMSNRLEIKSEEILEEIQGVAAIRPRPKFIGAFKQRKAFLKGYEKDPIITYTILWDRISRKRFLEPFTKETTNKLSKIKTPWLKMEMEEYIKDVGGRFIDPVYLLGINVSRLARSLNKAQSFLKLGYRPSTAMLNRLQPLQTAYQELDYFYFLGEGKRYTSSGKAILKELSVTGQKPKFATGDIFGEKQLGRAKLYQPMGMFTKMENANREAVGLGAYYKGIKMELSHQEAIEFGRAMVDVTQFRYDVSDLPKLFRYPIGKMVLQFRPFAINFLYNVKNILTGKPLGGLEKWEKLMHKTPASKVKRAIKFIGLNFLLGGFRTITSWFLPFGTAFIAYLAIKHPNIMQGGLSFLGIDFSKRLGASPFEVIPEDKWDLLGITAGDAQKIYKAIIKYEKTKDPSDLAKILKISPEIWNLYQALSQDKSPIKITPYERFLTAMGFEPSKLSKTRELMYQLNYFDKDQITPGLGLPTQQSLENMVYNLDSKDYDPKKKELIKEWLRQMEITDLSEYIQSRKQRMSESKGTSKDPFKSNIGTKSPFKKPF